MTHKLMLILVLFVGLFVAVSVAGDKSEASFPLFAFDNYMTVGDYTGPQVRADTLKDLGYDGMALAERTLQNKRKFSKRQDSNSFLLISP